jgi:transposase
MLNQESIVDIHVLHRQSCSIRGNSRQLGISHNTVRSGLRDIAKPIIYGPRSPGPSKLDTFKPYLGERIDAAKAHWIPTAVLFMELEALGYDGKEGIIKNYIRQFKPVTLDPVVRFETAPDHQMQIDFTTIKRGRIKLKGFVATLGYSRACYVYFSEYEKQEDWLTGMEGALNYFGAVPKE